MADSRSEIVFFDIETTAPRPGQGLAILEFGAILVCPIKLIELDSYSTLVCPLDLSLISPRSNGISPDSLASAPSFSDISDQVFDILHGRIWAGHNILKFDCDRIREAFAEIGRPSPEPKGIIDSLDLLTKRFGRRAGDMKMATLAMFFGLGKQTHRSLDDVRMNLEVLKYCATVLFLESSLPDILVNNAWDSPESSSSQFLTPDDVSFPYISAFLIPLSRGIRRIQILHNNVILKLLCSHLEVRFGISRMFVDQAGRQRLNFVVDGPPSLCQVLEACDSHAQSMFMQLGSSSDWRPVVSRKNGYENFPTLRLHIPTVVIGDAATYNTEIFQEETTSGAEQKLLFSKFDPVELEMLLTPGTFIDAFISLDPYDYQQNAGIRLIAKKLVIYSE